MSEEAWRGRHLVARVDDGWEYVSRLGSTGVVAIVAVTDADELVLVEQHRRPVGAAVIELPAGLVGDVDGAEGAVDAARRELLEETGYVAATWTVIDDGPISAGLTDEHVALLVARDLRRVGDGGGDEHEDITVHLVPLDDAQRFLRAARARGALVDPKVLAGLWLAGLPWDGLPLAP